MIFVMTLICIIFIPTIEIIKEREVKLKTIFDRYQGNKAKLQPIIFLNMVILCVKKALKSALNLKKFSGGQQRI